MQTVAEYIMRTLRCSGVEVVFGYPGESNLLLLSAAQSAGIRYIQGADERAAGFAATGYIQATGKPAIVCAGRGPGITNLLTPLVGAQQDGVPLIAITGNAPYVGIKCFQEFDPIEAFAPVAALKTSRHVRDVRMIPSTLHDMFTGAWSQPFGVGLLDVADDLLPKALNASPPRILKPPRIIRPRSPSALRSLSRAAQLLDESQRPIVIVGNGARQDYRLVRYFIRKYDIPAVHTIGGTGVISSADSLYGGLLRHNGTRLAAYLVQNADLVIALGTGLDERTTCDSSWFAANAIKIHVDLDSTVFQRRVWPEVAISESIAAYIIATTRTLPKKLSHSAWKEQYAEWLVDHSRTARAGPRITSPELIAAIAEYMSDAVVVKDAGLHKYWLTKYGACSSPRQSIASCHFGAMGFGLPAAIGASVGRRHERVLLACGDGCLLMSLSDLHTAARERCANLKIVVFNNGGLGATRNCERRMCGSILLTDFGGHLDLAAWAAAAGVESHRISNRADLESMAQRMRADGLVLFDCIVDPREPADAAVHYTESIDGLLRLPTESTPTAEDREWTLAECLGGS